MMITMALVVQEKLMNPAEPDDIVEFPECWCFTVVAKKWFVLMSLYYVCFSSGVATCLDYGFSMIMVKLGKR